MVEEMKVKYYERLPVTHLTYAALSRLFRLCVLLSYKAVSCARDYEHIAQCVASRSYCRDSVCVIIGRQGVAGYHKKLFRPSR